MFTKKDLGSLVQYRGSSSSSAGGQLEQVLDNGQIVIRRSNGARRLITRPEEWKVKKP